MKQRKQWAYYFIENGSVHSLVHVLLECMTPRHWCEVGGSGQKKKIQKIYWACRINRPCADVSIMAALQRQDLHCTY